MASLSSRDRWIALAKLALGVGLAAEGLSIVLGKDGDSGPLFGLGNQPRGVGGAGRNARQAPGVGAAAMRPIPHGTPSQLVRGYPHPSLPDRPSTKHHTVHSIDQRVSHIRRLVREGSVDPAVVGIARKILSQKCGPAGQERWCIPPKQYAGEVKALFRAVQDPRSPWAIRYTKDHPWVDQFASAPRTLLDWNAEDCDGGTTALASMLTAVGYPVKLRVIATRAPNGDAGWSHIYLIAGLPPTNPTMWAPLDWSVGRPPGWEAPGASECAATGRPAGVVLKVKDYDIYR